jgi:hypothetical protein
MLKRLLTLILLGFGIVATVSAENNPGYVYTTYGELVKDSYGQCVHTALYDSNNGLDECGEGSSSKNTSDNTK